MLLAVDGSIVHEQTGKSKGDHTISVAIDVASCVCLTAGGVIALTSLKVQNEHEGPPQSVQSPEKATRLCAAQIYAPS
jgi:hypothetical protein